VTEPSAGEPNAVQPPTPDRTERDVQYKGAPLDSAKGPGLGCFWAQVVLLVAAIILTPVSAAYEWPLPISIFLLAATLVLLLFVGQTAIFLMRLVAADRRAEGRRRPMRSATPTVGQIEDEGARGDEGAPGDDGAAGDDGAPGDDGTSTADERHADSDEAGGDGVRE
jgi:hypothetical protein